MDYESYRVDMATLMPTTLTDPGFNDVLPLCILYAENRIYRDLDLLATRTRDTSATLTANTRYFTLPQSMGLFYVVEGINIFTPSTSTPTTGVRQQLLPVTKEFIDATWPQEAAATPVSVPVYMAPLTDQEWMIVPPPDADYPVEVVGTIRPTTLSKANPETPLTILMPELFVAASMIFMSGKMHDWSPASDDPQMPVTWEAQYQKLMQGALVEESRKRYVSMAFQSRLPTPLAQYR